MNANFKPLGLVAAVATATAGYAGVVNAQESGLAGNTQLGDLALVPYYTVNEGYATGMSVINTADVTQVVKIRLRRAEDSMDALDFNVVLSPKDVYTGTIAAKGDDIVFVSNDNSCTAPEMPAGGFVMPNIYRNGAEEGYVEIISMGTPDSETAAIAVAAKHGADGVPADCSGVRDNFFKGGSASARGVENSESTWQYVTTSEGATVLANNQYDASPDSLKVSYFIKSDETGVEFGNNAVHIAGHMDGASMTNQQTGVFDGDLQGFDHPDLDGGAPASALQSIGASRGLYDTVVRPAIGAEALINDWSKNQNGPFTVDTDWVVTVPGQYLMLDLETYLDYLNPLDPDAECIAGDPQFAQNGTEDDAATCDFRDIPLTALFTVYDREEQGIVVDPGDLVVSPQPPGELVEVTLDQEVNVIEWGEAPVLKASKTIDVPVPPGAQTGWSNLSVTASADKTQAICDFNGSETAPKVDCELATSPVPLIGFVAWQRNFVDLAAANYGRIVEHSRVVSAVVE